MVEVGCVPILRHIMGIYMRSFYRDFVVCLGYKGEMVKRYFFEYPMMTNDVTVSNTGAMRIHADPTDQDRHFDVTMCDTGLTTGTAERLWRARRHISGPTFLCTYGDGLSDVRIQDVVEFHNKHGKLATCVSVQQNSRYGVLEFGGWEDWVRSFSEKPKSSEWVNAGFFVFSREVLDYCGSTRTNAGEPSLEGILRVLAKEGQLMAYRHDGFFASCDTSKDLSELNQLYDKGDAPGTKGN